MSVIKAFVRCQLHENWWSCARSAEMTEGIVVLFTVFHVAMFEVVERGQICHENLHRRFGKCLPEADSSAAIESCEREWMSLLPVRREEERALLVKSLRKELVWSLPLLCILVKRMEHDHDVSHGIDFVLTKSVLFEEVDRRVGRGRTVKAKSFLHDEVEEAHVLNSVKGDYLA